MYIVIIKSIAFFQVDIKYNQLSTLADYNIALTLAGIVIAEVRP